MNELERGPHWGWREYVVTFGVLGFTGAALITTFTVGLTPDQFDPWWYRAWGWIARMVVGIGWFMGSIALAYAIMRGLGWQD